jgi:hypothetical protein
MTTGYPFPGMTGPAFLLFYSGLTGIAAMLAILLRERLRATGHDRPVWGLNSLELAYLAGGKERAVAAVALGFLLAGAASIGVRERFFVIESDGVVLPPEIEPFRPCGRGRSGTKRFATGFFPGSNPFMPGWPP